jgi:hypothetical protein
VAIRRRGEREKEKQFMAKCKKLALNLFGKATNKKNP